MNTLNDRPITPEERQAQEAEQRRLESLRARRAEKEAMGVKNAKFMTEAELDAHDTAEAAPAQPPVYIEDALTYRARPPSRDPEPVRPIRYDQYGRRIYAFDPELNADVETEVFLGRDGAEYEFPVGTPDGVRRASMDASANPVDTRLEKGLAIASHALHGASGGFSDEALAGLYAGLLFKDALKYGVMTGRIRNRDDVMALIDATVDEYRYVKTRDVKLKHDFQRQHPITAAGAQFAGNVGSLVLPAPTVVGGLTSIGLNIADQVYKDDPLEGDPYRDERRETRRSPEPGQPTPAAHRIEDDTFEAFRRLMFPSSDPVFYSTRPGAQSPFYPDREDGRAY